MFDFQFSILLRAIYKQSIRKYQARALLLSVSIDIAILAVTRKLPKV